MKCIVVFSFWGLRPPDPLTRGSAPGPRWGHSPQTPIIGSRYTALAIATQTLKPNSAYGCIQNKGCTLWNNLPNHLQNYMSRPIHQFKTLVKRYLQECYYVDVNYNCELLVEHCVVYMEWTAYCV